MKFQQLPVTFGCSGGGDGPEGSWWYGVAFVALAVLAHELMPEVVLFSADASKIVIAVGITALFAISFLIPQPMQYLTLRTLALCLIASSILASPNFANSVLEYFSRRVPRDRAYAVSSVLSLGGLSALTSYWVLNVFNYAKKRRTRR